MGVFHPAALAFVLLAVVLWWFASRTRRHTVREVPALFLWDSLPPPPRERAARWDWLLLLQLLALTTLVLALARPYTDQPQPELAQRHLLILDRSASMQAKEGEQSRWQLAVDEALRYLRDLPAEDEVELVAVGKHWEVLVPATRDRRRVQEAIELLEPLDTEGRLGAALAELAARHGGAPKQHIVAFSDFADADLPASLPEGVEARLVGNSDRNLAVTEVRVQQHAWQPPEQAQATVEIRSFSQEPLHGWLTVQVENEVALQTGFTLAPRAHTTFSVPHIARAGRLTATVRADDALAVDNTAWAWVTAARPLPLCLVAAPGEDWTWLRQAARSLPILLLAPRNCSERTSPSDTRFVFFRRRPPGDLAAPALVVQAPAASGERLPAVTLVDWDASHPLLRAILPDPNASVTGARTVAEEHVGRVVLWGRAAGRDVPLVWVVRDNEPNRRQVWVNFDLAEKLAVSPDEEGWLLFFLQLLTVLSPERSEPASCAVGHACPLPSGAGETLVTDPRGKEQALDANRTWFVPLWQGLYQFERDGQQSARWVLPALGAESDIAPKLPAQPAVAAEAEKATAGETAIQRQEWTFPFLLGAALLLLLEAWGGSRTVRWKAR